MYDVNQLVLLKLREEKAKVEHHIVSNRIANFEDYKFNVGRLKGLNDSIEILLETLRRVNNV